jgi:hypothetical protein
MLTHQSTRHACSGMQFGVDDTWAGLPPDPAVVMWRARKRCGIIMVSGSDNACLNCVPEAEHAWAMKR